MAKHGRDDAMLPSAYMYLAHGSGSEVNCSGIDVRVVSCHCHLVVFHPFVDQLANYLLQHACIIYTILRLSTTVVLSQNHATIVRNFEIGTQSQDSENV